MIHVQTACLSLKQLIHSLIFNCYNYKICFCNAKEHYPYYAYCWSLCLLHCLYQWYLCFYNLYITFKKVSKHWTPTFGHLFNIFPSNTQCATLSSFRRQKMLFRPLNLLKVFSINFSILM